jgi:hypothetical protein
MYKKRLEYYKKCGYQIIKEKNDPMSTKLIVETITAVDKDDEEGNTIVNTDECLIKL